MLNEIMFLWPMKMSVLFFLFCFVSATTFAQTQPDPPYKRFPTLPPLKLLLTDSTTIFTDKDLKRINLCSLSYLVQIVNIANNKLKN